MAMKKLTKDSSYSELLDSLTYKDLGYTGVQQPLSDSKLKSFSDTIGKNKIISQTRIDSSMPALGGQKQIPMANVSGSVTQGATTDGGASKPMAKVGGQRRVNDTQGGEGGTDGGTVDTGNGTGGGTTGGGTGDGAGGGEIPLTTDSKYYEFINWSKEHGVDAEKVFADAMAQARTQYEQSRATYGRQAEQLAQAGLTNSGVSDNVERAAYAQKVQAEQAALDQKAALEQANKEGFAEFQEQQKSVQQQYNTIYQQLIDGYEDEDGNIHAGVSPELAVAQLKFAGMNDETMIAEAQKAYGAYKSVYDQQQADRQNAIAGTVTDDAGNVTFDPNSMFGKLFDGSMTSEDFLDQIQDDYGVRFNTDEEAVAALLKEGVITKEQSSLFYREMINNSIEAIVDSKQSAKETVKNGESDLYNAISTAKKAYDEGKMSKEDWDAFRGSIMSEGSPVHISIETGSGYNFIATLQIGDSTYTKEFVVDVGHLVLDYEVSPMLDNAANGMNMVVYNDELYLKYDLRQGSVQYGEDVAAWVRVPKVLGTKNINLKRMLKLLAEG